MSKWQFFEIDNDGNEKPFNSDFMIREWAEDALLAAAGSQVPDPKFSQYYVKCSIEVINNRSRSGLPESVCTTVIQGGNIEYGLCQALHGEESLVAALKSNLQVPKSRLEDYQVMVVFCSRFENGKVPTCCGNCRDIMRDALPLDTMIFGGHPNGGKVIVARLWNLLGDEYRKSPTIFTGGVFKDNESEEQLGRVDFLESTIGGCLKLENDIYFPGIPNPGRRYYAIIRGHGYQYFGAHDVMCDYHPIYAIRDAIRQARRHNRPEFSHVIVASEYHFPDVMYKDRQHLLELNFQQECVSGQPSDPPIYLVMYERDAKGPKIRTVFKTSVKKWLPFPFSPANFGDEFVQNAAKKFKKI